MPRRGASSKPKRDTSTGSLQTASRSSSWNFRFGSNAVYELRCNQPRYLVQDECAALPRANVRTPTFATFFWCLDQLRDVEDLLAERGILVSHETVRRWVNHFGPMIAADLRKRRPKPYSTWHLDEGI